MADIANRAAALFEPRPSAGPVSPADGRAGFYEASPDALLTVDHEGRILDLNRAAEATFGYSLATAIGQGIEQLIIPRPLRAGFRARLERFLATGASEVLDHGLETRALRANGQEFPVELSIAAIGSGPASVFVVQMRDITGRRQEENQMRRAVGFSEELLGMISHELRSPLAAIRGNARLLATLRPEATGEEAESLRDLAEDAARAERVVSNMLALGRAASSRVQTEPVMLSHTLRDWAERFRQSRPSRQILVQVEDSLPPALAEPTFLDQIIENLLTNADKYSPPESPVHLIAVCRGPMAEVTVRDEGPGLAREDVEHLFDAYFRAGHTAARAPGIGLGLTVCKRLTEAQGGRMAARLADPHGLAVLFTLPLAPLSDE
jgi:PAS domain S-box-containing protein